MDKQEYYLGIASAVAAKSTCLKKHYGAVIVKNNEIIATGYNGPPRGEKHCAECTKSGCGKDMEEYMTCPAVHAEMNAIISAARRDMIDSDLYLSGIDAVSQKEIDPKPCKICERLIKNAGIARVITRKDIKNED